MEKIYQQILATMSVEDVSFILSQLSSSEPHSVQNTTLVADPENGQTEDDEENRRRRHIEREWPEVGTILSSEYYGATYTAEIIPAAKRLKSGKQIRITSGPTQGMTCDSFSEAMLCATELQRNEEGLARKGVSNGWDFWQWDGKSENDQNKGDGVL